MIYPIDQLPSHLNKPEQSLQWHMLQAQLRTNELLEQLINGNKQETEKIHPIEELKRPELMKLMAQKNAPQGWNKWGNEQLISYLKEVS